MELISHNSEMREVNRYFPNLRLLKNTICGEMEFSAKYKLLSSELNQKWEIVPCSSGQDCIQDVYEIEIRLNELRDGKPKVFETGGKIANLARELKKPIIDLHIYPNGEDCCIGIFLNNPNEKLSEFVVNKVYPYFVWQGYFAKFRKTPPCGEWSHGKDGFDEFVKQNLDVGRNELCPCRSGKKFKRCCNDKIQNYARKNFFPQKDVRSR